MPAEVGGRKTELGTQSCISALPQNPGDLEQNSLCLYWQARGSGCLGHRVTSLCPCWVGSSQSLEAPEQGREKKVGTLVTSSAEAQERSCSQLQL